MASVVDWWNSVRLGQLRAHDKEEVIVAVYIFWHLWKERGRQNFQSEFMPASAVASLVRSDVELICLAKRLR